MSKWSTQVFRQLRALLHCSMSHPTTWGTFRIPFWRAGKFPEWLDESENTVEELEISVDPSSCGGSRVRMLSGVASSGVALAELTDNNTTVDNTQLSTQAVIYTVSPSEPMTMLGTMFRYTTIETLVLCP